MSPVRKFIRLLAVCLTLPLGAAAEGTKDQLSDQTADELGKTKTLADAQNWDAALHLVDTRLAKVDSESFDAAVLLQIQSQLRLQKATPGDTAEPLTRSLDVADRHGYFEPAARTQMAFLLAQLLFQEAVAAPASAEATGRLDRAILLMDRWERETKKPTFDAVFFHASLLYNRSVTGRSKADEPMLSRALAEIDKAMLLINRPPETLYQLKAACLQQLGRFAEAGETLEQLVALKPTDGATWLQLVSAYVTASGETKDPKAAYSDNVRAIVTIERAQAHGFMLTPKDKFNLIGIHFNIQQYDRAIELLDAGLRDGTIAGERKNWELLAYSYQQAGRDTEALKTLENAALQFPDAAQIDFQIAQLDQALNRTDDAIGHLRQCVAKGGGDTPYAAYLSLSYLALEKKNYEEARAAAESAMKYPEGLKEGQRMKKAVEDTMAAHSSL